MKKQRIEQSFGRAVQTYTKNAVAQRYIVNQLVRIIPENLKLIPNGRLIEIGCGCGFLTQKLSDIFDNWQAIINDLSPSWEPVIEPIIARKGWKFKVGDAEHFPFVGKFDLIASSSTLQWFEDPERFIALATERLNSRGILLISTFGKRNLHELRTITGSGLTYRSIEELTARLPSDMTITSLEEELMMEFDSPMAVLNHLRQTGVNGVTSQVWSKRHLETFCREYPKICANSNHVTLTYHPIYLLIQKH